MHTFQTVLVFVAWLKICGAYLVRDNHNKTPYTFPDGFKFGVSTSAYQIEGAWNLDGKGENMWDRFTHDHPERIKDQSTGNIACDSYHKYKEDVQLLVSLGVDFYRFSLSWSRILPSGFTNRINKKGLEYYSNLIDELLKHNIEPMVTIYHWDLPQPLQDLGGWTNPLMADYYVDYAKVLFKNLGDRVKTWITFNEPKLICNFGYGIARNAPAINSSGVGEYLCGHTLLRAHGKTYRLYEKKYKKNQKGRIGISIHSEWFEPQSGKFADMEASERRLTFDIGWFGNPIFHKFGDYPSLMKNRIFTNSLGEGYPVTRLPEFTPDEIQQIQGSSDFLGLNYYTTSMIADENVVDIGGDPSYYKDVGVKTWKDPSWPVSAAERLKVVPWGLRNLLEWIVQRYGNISIIITENGYADKGEIEDNERLHYYMGHLQSLLEAINIDGINVTGYTAWSLLDNFEWVGGYTERYGLFAVDFKKRDRPRIQKKSAVYYRKVISSRNLDWNETYYKNNTFSAEPNIYFISWFLLITFIRKTITM